MEGETGAILGLCTHGWGFGRECGELKVSSLDYGESAVGEKQKNMNSLRTKRIRERSRQTARKAWASGVLPARKHDESGDL